MKLTFPLLPLSIVCCCLGAFAALSPVRIASAADEEKLFFFDDQYIQIEARLFSGESSNVFGIEVGMTPQPGWKLSAGNSSSIKPLRLKFSKSPCFKTKGSTHYSAPDLSGTDDSGSYSEYFTRTAYIRQEFSRLKCGPKSGSEGVATATYLLCQDSKCVGPFSKEIRFKAPGRK